MILAIRTDNAAEATIVLLDQAGKIVATRTWPAGRKLSAQLLPAIEELMRQNDTRWEDLAGVIAYEGPGSFTGLRIGVTTVNAIGYARSIPAAGARGDDWLAAGVKNLAAAKPGTIVRPHYGAEPNISQPKS